MTEREIAAVLVDNRHELRQLIRQIGDVTLRINGIDVPALDALQIGHLTLSEWLPLLDATDRPSKQVDITSNKGDTKLSIDPAWSLS